MRALLRVLGVSLLLFPALLSAAPPVAAGPVLKVGPGGGPQVAVFPDGGFVVVWDTASTLHARLFDHRGVATTGEIQILRPAGQIVDAVAALPGGFVVVWDQPNRYGVYSVFARVFSRTGAPFGSPAKIHRTSLYSRCCAQVAAAPGGGFAVAWSAYAGTDRDPGFTSSVLQRFFDPSGKPLGPEPQEPPLLSNPPDPQDLNWVDALTVTSDGVLRDVTLDQGDDADLNLGHDDGSSQGLQFIAESTADDDVGFNPNLASAGMLSDGGFVLAWPSDFFFIFHPSSDIYAQRFDAGGLPTGNGPLKVNVRPGREIQPVLTTLPDGGFAALWSEVGADPARTVLGVFGRFFSAAGRATTQEFALGAPGAKYGGYTLAAGASGDVVAVWSQQGSGGGGAGVYARVLRTGSH